MHERPVDPHEAARERIVELPPGSAAQQDLAQRRSQGQRDHGRRDDHERLGDGQGREQPSRFAGKREYGQEAQSRDQERGQDGGGEGARRREDGLAAFLRRGVLADSFQATMTGLERDHVRVHRHAQCDSDAAQAHDRRGHSEQPHAGEGQEQDQRQGGERDEGAPEVQQEHQDHEHDHAHLFGQGAEQRVTHAVDQVSPVVDGDDLDPFLELRAQLLDLAFGLLDDAGRVRVPIGDDDAAGRRIDPVEVRNTARHVVVEMHVGQIRDLRG